jgi:hypothetical protein
MILYHDECIPGNVLAPDNLRKGYCFYFTFRELQPLLSHQSMWMCLGILRSSEIKAAGGLNLVMAKILRFFNDSSKFFSTGEVITIENEPFLLSCVISDFIVDEAGMKATWESKGASGLKPCFRCANVIQKGNAHLEFLDASFVDITCADVRKFVPIRDEEYWNLSDQLNVMAPGALKMFQKAAGFNHVPNGVLSDPVCRRLFKPSISTYDPMHCFYSNGMVAVEVCLFFSSHAKRTGSFDGFIGGRSYSGLDCEPKWL